ncbi:hypothetical protein AMATHDRAFT_66076 [Amanita thiersii Skay4041]|uniref:Uncharacterized protein n=1 Tax=Amanita thiersii Skay4041 TaxID=703135 RepID=A0A2A9NKG7_9AGAR|nr:hypothetical protein AMATHDRAFT_66076 [Amanita thiersii Skay4041]
MHITTNSIGHTITITIPDALDSAIQYALRLTNEHPQGFALLLFIWSFYPEFPFDIVYYILIGIPTVLFLSVINCLGFIRRGVARGSYAAEYQSRMYGPFTPANSYFAQYQSYGALGIHHPLSDEDLPRRRGLGMTLFSWGLFLASIYVFLDSVVHNRNTGKWSAE